MSEIDYGEVRKRSIEVGRVKTSISIEDAFWNQLRRIASRRGIGLFKLISDIDFDREKVGNLSSAIRQFVLHDALERIDDVETRAAVVLPTQAARAVSA